MKIIGPFRMYFNKSEEYPRIACIGAIDGAWELCVSKVSILGGVNATDGYKPTAVHPIEPKWWIEFNDKHECIVDDLGHARIVPRVWTLTA